MESIGIYEAKAQLSRLVEHVGRGHEITITKHGKAIARLVAPRKAAPSARVQAFAEIDRMQREFKVRARFDLRAIIEEGRS